MATGIMITAIIFAALSLVVLMKLKAKANNDCHTANA
jgi:hypothetical protein